MPELDSVERDIIMVADYFVPAPDHDSASLRLVHLMTHLAKRAHVVFMPALDAPATPEAVRRLHDVGIPVLGGHEGQVRFLVDHGHRVRLAFLSRPHSVTRFLGPIREHAPQAVVAYDTVDLHHRRLHREADLADSIGRVDRFQLRADAVSMRALEEYLVHVCDLTIAVSEDDADGLREIAPGTDVRVISNVHPASPRTSQPGSERISFIGYYPHRPNADAALWFADAVMPRVLDRVPHAVVELIGADPPPELRARESSSVRVLGWVDDLDRALAQTAVGVAPLRFGAGVKGKVGEMARRGIPVVSTSVGVEGMGLHHGSEVLVADDAEGLAAHIVELLTDAERARQIGRAGCERIEALFGVEQAASELDRLLDTEVGARPCGDATSSGPRST